MSGAVPTALWLISLPQCGRKRIPAGHFLVANHHPITEIGVTNSHHLGFGFRRSGAGQAFHLTVLHGHAFQPYGFPIGAHHLHRNVFGSFRTGEMAFQLRQRGLRPFCRRFIFSRSFNRTDTHTTSHQTSHAQNDEGTQPHLHGAYFGVLTFRVQANRDPRAAFRVRCPALGLGIHFGIASI